MLTEILDETDVFEDVNVPSSKIASDVSDTAAAKATPLARSNTSKLARSSTSKFRIADCPTKPIMTRSQPPAFQSLARPSALVTPVLIDDDDQSTSLLRNEK